MAFFDRNLPLWERGIRGAAGIAAIAWPLIAGWNGPWLTGAFVTGGSLIGMAVFGFCPACALAGRRLGQG